MRTAEPRACRLELLNSVEHRGFLLRRPRPLTHCVISYFIAAGLDWKQISTWARHRDVRQIWNRYGHLVPGGEEAARERLDAYLNPRKPIPTVAHDPINEETPESTGVLQYRYRDSKPPSEE
jgi:hypothetical protein